MTPEEMKEELDKQKAENEKLKKSLAEAGDSGKNDETRKRLEFLEAEHKQLIEARDKAKEEKRKAEEARLAEQGEYKTLAEQEKAQREQIEEEHKKATERLEKYHKRDEEKLAAIMEKVPESKRELIRDDLDIDYRLKLAESYIDEKPPAPNYRPPGESPTDQPKTSVQRISEGLKAGALN